MPIAFTSGPIFVPRATVRSPRGFAQRAALALLRSFERTRDTLWTRPRNLFFSLVLETDRLSLGHSPRIRGRASIHLGSRFTALNNLWLEAVDYLGGYHPTLTIGSRVTCGDAVHIAATNLVRIGNDVLIGSRVLITDHNHGLYQGDGQSSPIQRPAERALSQGAQTIVEDNVWIGDGVVLLAGSSIGRGSIIGANSVVRGRIPPGCIAAGNPARVIRTYSAESETWQTTPAT